MLRIAPPSNTSGLNGLGKSLLSVTMEGALETDDFSIRGRSSIQVDPKELLLMKHANTAAMK